MLLLIVNLDLPPSSNMCSTSTYLHTHLKHEQVFIGEADIHKKISR